jgi:hypothetical protein
MANFAIFLLDLGEFESALICSLAVQFVVESSPFLALLLILAVFLINAGVILQQFVDNGIILLDRYVFSFGLDRTADLIFENGDVVDLFL